MRLFEGVLFFLSIFTAVALFVKGALNAKVLKGLSLSSFVIFIIHYFTEGTRWQLYPMYLFILVSTVLTVMSIFKLLNVKGLYEIKVLRRLTKVLTILMLILSMLSAYAFPVYKMSKPNGPYKIGTVTFDAVDPNRKAIYSTNESNNRKIRVQLWYPSDNVEGYKRVPWLEDGAVIPEGLSKMMGMPNFIFSHTTLVDSNSYKNAPISLTEAKYPIVIISHGWTGFRNLHTDVAEMLASNGYIVAAIDHTYGAAVTAFDDGEVDFLNREALPNKDTTPNFLDYANTLVNTYAGDISFTIDKLEEINSGKIDLNLKDKLDLSRIGLLGHSTGGGAGVTTAIKDNRVKAVMGFDAWVEPIKTEVIQQKLKVPALFLRSEQWKEGPNNNNLYSLVEDAAEYKGLYQINGMIHQDFTMIYMYSPISKYLGLTGKLDGWKGASIQQDFVLNFFNDYLMKKSSTVSIQEVADRHSEVEKIK